MLLFNCRWPVNSLHKWPVMWKMFPFDDVIMSILTNFSWESPSGFAYNLITADGALTYVFKVNCGLIHSSCAPFFQDYTTTARVKGPSSHWPRFYIVTLFRIKILWIIIDWFLRNIPAQICSGFLTVDKIMSTQQRSKRLNIYTRKAKILRLSKMDRCFPYPSGVIYWKYVGLSATEPALKNMVDCSPWVQHNW